MDAVAAKAIPGPVGLPLIGVAHKMLGRPLAYQEELVRQYGRVNRVRLGRQRLIMLHDAYAIDEILRKQGKNFPKAPAGMDASRPLLGTSVATEINREHWQFMHNMVLPLFTPNALAKYWKAAVSVVEQEVQAIGELARSGETFDLYVYIHEAMFRILMRTIFSGDFSDDRIAEMVKLFDEQTTYISARYLTNMSPLINLVPSVRRGKRALEKLDRYVGDMIRKRQANPPVEANDMLDVLLLARKDDGSALTFQELRDNCMTMLFGGHETTAGSVTWAFGLLDVNRDARDRFYAEVDDVLRDGIGELSQLRDFNYTGMVLDEAMRFYPMFPYLFREAAVDTRVLDYEIKAGDVVVFSAWTTHRDPRFWPEPEKFIPERHSPDQKKERLSAAFLPFSHGQRRCIGERVARMEAYLLLAMISREYELQLVNGHLPGPKVSMSIKPDGGMPVRAVPRAKVGR